MKEIHLYINGQEVDLGEESLVLYNWSETELSNPSTTQNSFSKVLTLLGTKRNNRVFNHLWNLERVQGYNGELNASRRIPFRITFDGDNIFEEGYCKLQNVKLVNGVYKYEVSLFGTIGNFLNNLATNFSDGTVKTLADLKYFYEEGGEKKEHNLDFNINLSAVTEAWQNMNYSKSKWSVLNFANCYNGIPQNMDADKVLFDGAGDYSPFLQTYAEGNYYPSNNRIVAKTANKMSKDEVKDLRSYLMTPVIRTKKVIEAICDKENNAGEYDEGYDVELDPDFFRADNPFYDKTFMTLPQITSLKVSNTSKNEGETILTAMTFVKKELVSDKGQVRYTYNIELPEELKDWADFEIEFGFATPFDINPQHQVIPGFYLRNGVQVATRTANAYAVQAYAITDEATSAYENIIAGSNLYWMTSDECNVFNYPIGFVRRYFKYEDAVNSNRFTPRWEPSNVISNYKICWKKLGEDNTNTLLDESNSNSRFSLKLVAPVKTRNIRLCVDMVNQENGFGDWTFYYNYEESGEGWWLYPLDTIDYYDLYSKYSTTGDYITGRLITKQNLLTTSYSVKDWLLSYCKLFGLYIWYDLINNKLHIDTRKTFYQRDNITDISHLIDLNKDYSIKPVFADSKFYNMTQEQVSSDLDEDYKNVYGKVYGMKTIDTGVDLDLQPKELLDIKFKSAIMNNKKSLYNYKPTVVDSTTGVTAYMCDGLTYNLYKNGDAGEDAETVEITKAPYVIQTVFDGAELVSGRTYEDLTNKALFEKDGKVSDGANVLLFMNGFVNISNKGYYLSDDIPSMISLNGKPTWIVTKYFEGKNYVKQLDSIPDFSRYRISNRHILHSLDYGSPRQLYIPDVINHEESTLYNIYYKTYYEDLYDVNIKVLNCYFKPKNILSIYDLRRFYWFDNSLWRLNKVTDYNPENEELVKAEFIKVQDVADITSSDASDVLTLTLNLEGNSVGYKGGTIKGTVVASDYGPWSVEEADGVFIYPYGNSTNCEITVDVPPNNSQNDLNHLLMISAGDVAARAYIEQPSGYGEIDEIVLNVSNQTNQIIRIGIMLDYDSGISYRTIAAGATEEYIVAIPYNGISSHYDLELSDVFGNASTFTYTFTKQGQPTITGDGIDDFNYNATNVGADDINYGTITVTE